jgi:hypothetical protein
VTDVSASTTVTTDFLLDGQNVARSFSSEGASKDKAWLVGPRGPECELTGYRPVDTNGDPILDGNGAPLPTPAEWAVYDGLGSVAPEVSALGASPSV